MYTVYYIILLYIYIYILEYTIIYNTYRPPARGVDDPLDVLSGSQWVFINHPNPRHSMYGIFAFFLALGWFQGSM